MAAVARSCPYCGLRIKDVFGRRNYAMHLVVCVDNPQRPQPKPQPPASPPAGERTDGQDQGQD